MSCLIQNIKCPSCLSSDIKFFRTYLTVGHGKRAIYTCQSCHNNFSETKKTFIENLHTPIQEIIKVLKARTEGLSFNATCRTFSMSKETLSSWEKKFCRLKIPLKTYALTHKFLSQQLEGDELYTKVNKNTEPHESEGWTMVIMDRASRFIWELECGKKDEDLFTHVLLNLLDIIKNTGDCTLFTDGERRYGNILFDLCCEAIIESDNSLSVDPSGSGTDKKFSVNDTPDERHVLPKNVRVRLKNKGAKHTKQNKPKYEAPQKEHPETTQNIDNKDIHANHAEGFNSALRRKNSSYRRRTNTYAKNIPGLQKTLDIHWIAHNFIVKQFTTQKIPAVAIGILVTAFSWSDVFAIQVF